MIKVFDILDFLNQACPFGLAEEWDNVGLNLGRAGAKVEKVLLALDADESAILAAKEQGCQLLLTHHPLLFDPLRQITDGTPAGHKALLLAESGIAHIACHTNLDAAQGGVNDHLAACCGMEHPEPFEGLGRMGDLEIDASALIGRLKERLPAKTCMGLIHHSQIHRAALVGGSGGSMLQAAWEQGCDTFITGEAKHDHALFARDHGMNLLILGHYETEYIVLEPLKAALEEHFEGLECLLMPHRPVLEQF